LKFIRNLMFEPILDRNRACSLPERLVRTAVVAAAEAEAASPPSVRNPGAKSGRAKSLRVGYYVRRHEVSADSGRKARKNSAELSDAAVRTLILRLKIERF
jgi:hypothetical protein